MTFLSLCIKAYIFGSYSDRVCFWLTYKASDLQQNKQFMPLYSLQINIDFCTRDHITQTISEPTLQCFDDAQRLIYSLMAKDSFPRFLKSEAYKELVNKQQNGNQKRWLPFL